MIKSEDTFLLGYVLFDMKPGKAEVNVVEDCQRYLQEKIDSGEFVLAGRRQLHVRRQLREPDPLAEDADGRAAAGAVHHLHHPLFPVPLGHHDVAGFSGIAFRVWKLKFAREEPRFAEQAGIRVQANTS